jgi:hypothetical protein
MSAPQVQKPINIFSPKHLNFLLAFNLTWSVLGLYADWNWLSAIPFYLVPFTVICSLYPALLFIIFFYLKRNFHPPQFILWLTSIGLITYGLAAQIYFPLLMSWRGFNLHDFGSIFWVAAYGLQFFLIRKYLQPIPVAQLLMIISYFIIVNCSHYFYPTFIDFILFNYPLWLKYLTATLVIALQIFAINLIWRTSHKNLSKTIH